MAQKRSAGAEPDLNGRRESGGGAYPNPHRGKDGGNIGFMGHGAQTEMACHGPGQLGDEKAGDTPNAPADER
jgi:hypothetical protein